ncbi:MAG: aspartate kinase [Planctomycetota bacterium]
MSIVAKFGGTSVATAAQQRKVAAIVAADPRRRFIVPSAPGKAHKQDTKLTDLLYLANELALARQDIEPVWNRIEERFLGIVAELGLVCPLQAALDAVRDRIAAGADDHYVASRGEALNGLIIAALCDAEFVDAAEVIRFDRGGRFDPASYGLVAERCVGSGRYVIPGFYGARPDGSIRTFSRGGSDVTGAIVANAVDASVYENWTDVSGFRMTDPRIVPEAKAIEEITYTELRELSYMGASVLHEGAVFPVCEKGIPIQIRNTDDPEHLGTRIVADRDPGTQVVVGIAGKSDFAVFYIEKALMNEEVGFGRRVLDVFERLGISYEHTPSGIDTLSVVVSAVQLGDKEEQVLEDLRSVHPDQVRVYHGMGLIATVGKGMNRTVGTAARLFSALAQAQVNVRMIDQGSSEQNIIVGVEQDDLPKAIRAIYDTFAA